MNPSRDSKPRGTSAIDGAMALIVVLLIVQMWLLSAALDTYLASHRETATPAAIASGLLFLICGALCRFVIRIERGS